MRGTRDDTTDTHHICAEPPTPPSRVNPQACPRSAARAAAAGSTRSAAPQHPRILCAVRGCVYNRPTSTANQPSAIADCQLGRFRFWCSSSEARPPSWPAPWPCLPVAVVGELLVLRRGSVPDSCGGGSLAADRAATIAVPVPVGAAAILVTRPSDRGSPAHRASRTIHSFVVKWPSGTGQSCRRQRKTDPQRVQN